MDLWNDLSKKAAKMTEKAMDKTKDIANQAETKIKEKSLEYELDHVYQALGQYYYQMIKDQKIETMDPSVQEMIEKIDALCIDIRNASR